VGLWSVMLSGPDQTLTAPTVTHLTGTPHLPTHSACSSLDVVRHAMLHDADCRLCVRDGGGGTLIPLPARSSSMYFTTIL
jgi:hypothetical protein